MNIKLRYLKAYMGTLIASIAILASCEDDDLPEVGDLPDLTPPSANFVAIQKEGTDPQEDFKIYFLTNQSVSSTDYQWQIPDGVTLLDLDPDDGVTPTLASENINLEFPGEGTFDVTLTSSDKLGKTSSVTKSIEVIMPEIPMVPVPEILEGGFDMGNDSRDPWRNGDLGGVIQITSSPVQSGSNAAKFPSDGSRIAYQEIDVTPNVDYTLTYYYTLKTSPEGSIRVAILGGEGFTDPAAAEAAIIASDTGNDQSSSSSYVQVDLKFNSGSNSKVAIYVTNEGAEARVDSFSIAVDGQ